MRIVDVEYIPLEAELEKPLVLSVGEIRRRPFALVRVETDNGVVGYGEAFANFPPWSIYEKYYTFERGVKPLILGEDPLKIEKVWWKMYTGLYRWGLMWGKGAVMQAISAVDIALWDIKGKVLGEPIYDLLGGLYREEIPLYATGISMDDPVGHAKRLVSKGYRALKLRVGFGVERDLELVRRVREKVGRDVWIMVDANMAWDRWQALRMAKAFEKFDIFWLEEPVRADDYEAMKWLSEKTEIPLAAGENAHDIFDFKALLLEGGIRFFMPDVSKAGGFTGVLRGISLAESLGITCSPHYYGSDLGFAASLHLVASKTICAFIQRDVSPAPLRERVLKTRIRIENGYAHVPRGPGLGVEIDEDVIEEHRVEIGA